MMQLCSHMHKAKSSSHAFRPLNSHIDLFPPPLCHSRLRERQIDAWPLWSCMCLTGWAWEPVLDTGGTNYPLIMHCWQSLWDGGETERRKATARAGSEKLDSVSSLSRVFDGPAVTRWMMHKRICRKTACVLSGPFSIRCMLYPMFVIKYEGSHNLWNIHAAVFSYLCTLMWLAQEHVSIFSSLMHKIHSLLGSALSSD